MDNETNVSVNCSETQERYLKRKIFSNEDVLHWKKCSGYLDLTSFLRQINHFAYNQNGESLANLDKINHLKLIELKQLLELLSRKVDEIEPIKNDLNQRFGNKAFKIWYDQMFKELDIYFKTFTQQTALELRQYLEESFGNQIRIDYGTGHELNFFIFLLGLYKLELYIEGSNKEAIKDISRQLLTIFAYVYIPLCRKIQLAYRLEPAGSHGVFSLDDYQYLPFLFGSAELIDHPSLEPKTFTEQNHIETYKDKYMFYSAIDYIIKVKNGPFYEHSNQLWNISGVSDWSKMNNGLYRKYCDEVLHKFPIVQHLVFGKKVLVW